MNGEAEGQEPDPVERVTAAFADIGDRLVEYANVWRSAIDRNAEGAYAADDFLVDLQTLWGMSVRDVARFGAAYVEAVAPLLPEDRFGSPKRPGGEGGEESPAAS